MEKEIDDIIKEVESKIKPEFNPDIESCGDDNFDNGYT
jgi:hypothetical protein